MKVCRLQVVLLLDELLYPHQHALHHVKHVQSRVQGLKTSSDSSGAPWESHLNVKQKLTWVWDSDVILGSFSPPTDTDRTDPSETQTWGQRKESPSVSDINRTGPDLWSSCWWRCAAPSHSELWTCSVRHAAASGRNLLFYTVLSRSLSVAASYIHVTALKQI